MVAAKYDVPGWTFLDDEGTFRLENADQTGYLYLPLVNGAGLMASMTPSLGRGCADTQALLELAAQPALRIEVELGE